MDQFIAVVGVILAGLGFYFYKRSERAGRDAILGETKGEDKQLKKQQDAVKEQIDSVEKRDDSKITPEERANRWNK